MFHLQRVFANDEIPEVLHARHRRTGLAFERSFSPADQTLIGFNLDEDIRTVGIGSQRNTEHLHVRDAQICIYVFEEVGVVLTTHTLRQEGITSTVVGFSRYRF